MNPNPALSSRWEGRPGRASQETTTEAPARGLSAVQASQGRATPEVPARQGSQGAASASTGLAGLSGCAPSDRALSRRVASGAGPRSLRADRLFHFGRQRLQQWSRSPEVLVSPLRVLGIRTAGVRSGYIALQFVNALRKLLADVPPHSTRSWYSRMRSTSATHRPCRRERRPARAQDTAPESAPSSCRQQGSRR